MKKQQQEESGKLVRVRTWVLMGIFAALLGTFAFVLYDVQVVHGQDYLDRAYYSVARTESVGAARGELLDAYGRVLVSNESSYQVTLDTTLMGTRAERYATLLALLELCRTQEVTWTDTLPITRTAPYAYTLDIATDSERSRLRSLTTYYQWDQWTVTVVKAEEAQAVLTDASEAYPLTPEQMRELLLEAGMVGRLHGLDELPDRAGYAATAAQSQGAQEDEVEVWTPTLSAQTLLDAMVERYQIDELLPDLTATQRRDLAGVLYELDLRTRELTYTEYVFAAQVDISFITLVKEARLAGVSIDTVSTRRYHTIAASHILGRVGAMDAIEWTGTETTAGYRDAEGYAYNDRVGKDGVERAFESYLHGVSGTRAIETDSTGKIINESWLTEPEPGYNVSLTLDLQLQTAVEEALARHIEGLEESSNGAAVLVDMTGGVLAMASYPGYDLSRVTDPEYYRTLSADPLTPMYNFATQGTYMPGSIFKMVTGLAGLQEGLIAPTTQIRDRGVFTGYTSNTVIAPKCWIFRQYGGTHGMETVTTAIRDSCNYFFYDVGARLGIEKLGEYANMLGLGVSTGIEIPERTGSVAGPETSSLLGTEWYEGATTSAAIGQENNLFTPLQLANYIATLVNGGTHYSAHLLKSVRSADYGQVIYEYAPTVLNELDIAPANLEAIKRGMYLVTQTGSVSAAFNRLPVRAGAKTGTAQVNNNTATNATFVCFAPYDDPQVALCLVVEEGSSGASLASLAAEILQYYFNTEETFSAVSGENTLLR